ncbi:MAG TPA: ECF transporter S component [Ktedonobacteraceae bacterium]|nr:ECF transporter S component [Ktedonobacteraceae bacterium]
MATEERSTLTNERESIWSVGVRQVVYIALGIALYAVFNIIFNLVQLPNAGGGAIALRPGIVIPLFFGVVFGPIVGLFVGGFGNIIGDLISYHNFYWNWDLGNALIGFIAGLAMLYTTGRYRTTRAIVIAEVFSAIAIIIGIGIAAYIDIWVSKISFAAATSEWIVAGVPDLLNALILLPILLVAYNAAMRGRGRA